MNAKPKRCLVLALLLWLVIGLAAFAQSSDFDRGMVEFRAGNFEAAAKFFASAEAASPNTTGALLYEAKSLVHMQDFGGADQALRGYIKMHAESPDALYMLGFVLHRENRPADSLTFYTKAAAINPPTSDDLKIVGLDYVLLDDYPDAIQWLVKATALDDKNKDAFYYLGRAYYSRAQLTEARAAFQRVLELDPHDAKAENNLGLIFESSGQINEAIAAYREAITWQEQSGHVNEQPYVNLGNLLMEQGRMAEAQAPLEKAVALAPANPFCHLILGEYYAKLENLEPARRELEQATKLDPENAVAHYQLGRLYTKTHEATKAKAEFDRTAELKARASGAKRADDAP